MTQDDPALWTLAEASAALVAGRITARALLEACLARIAFWQPVTNAFIDLRADAARIAADGADAEMTGGHRRSPLHGIPLAHKDMYYREGQISTCGSTLRREFRPTQTATVLRRLDLAGAIDLGTLNMAEWAGGATGHNLWFGDACNPWDPARVTGGSSSGSGASVAARMVFGALGSDTGGSIRLPASICGVTGLKPSWGAVSRAGVMPRAWNLDCVGPLARTAQDCAVLFATIAGPDPADPTSMCCPTPSLTPLPENLAGVRIGVERHFLGLADPALRPAFDGAIEVFGSLGALITEVELPERDLIFDLCAVISATEAASLHHEMMRDHPDGYAPDLFGRTQAGLATPAVLYLDALRARGPLLARARAEVFTTCDALFAPGLTVPVPTRENTRCRSAEDIARLHGPLVRTTRAFNFLGLPVLSMPCGRDAAGMPIGLQLAGPPFAEATLLGIGMAFQAATDFHVAAPALPH